MSAGRGLLWGASIVVGASFAIGCDPPTVENETITPDAAAATACTIADECFIAGVLRLCSPFTGFCVTGTCSATEACADGYTCDPVEGLCRFGPSCDGDAACGEGVCWAFGFESEPCGSACSAAPALGEHCLILDDGPDCFNRKVACEAGLECFVEHLAIASLGTCVVPRSRGEPCGGYAVDEDGCANEFICAGGGRSGELFIGTCEEPAPAGSVCLVLDAENDASFRHDCPAGLICVEVPGDESPAESRCQ